MCSLVQIMRPVLLNLVIFINFVRGAHANLYNLRYFATDDSFQVPPQSTPDDSFMNAHYYVLDCNYINSTVRVYDAAYKTTYPATASHKVQNSLEDEALDVLVSRKLSSFFYESVYDLGDYESDYREIVTNNKQYPFNSIGYLTRYTSKNEQQAGVCAGVLIAPSVVLTTANCVFDPTNSQFYQTLNYTLPQDGFIDASQKTTFVAVQSTIKMEYTLGKQSFDFGLVLLDGQVPARYMSFGYDCSLALPLEKTLSVAAYLESNSMTMEMSEAVCQGGFDMCPSEGQQTEDFLPLNYYCDGTQGMVGAPIWETDATTGEASIRALHHGDNYALNEIVVLTPSNFQYINDVLARWGEF